MINKLLDRAKNLSPERQLMYTVLAYTIGVIAGACMFAFWPSTTKYAWFELHNPIALWIGIGFIVLSFTCIVCYIVGRANKTTSKEK